MLTDQAQVVRGQRRRAGSVQDAVEVTALEGARRGCGLLAPADDLESGLLAEGVAELLEAFAGAREVDADVVAHRGLLRRVETLVDVSGGDAVRRQRPGSLEVARAVCRAGRRAELEM